MLLVIKMKKLLLYIAIIFFAYSCGTKRVIYNNKKTEPEKEKKVKRSKSKKIKGKKDVVIPKINNTEDYINYYSSIAMDEMIQFGIPASITLAQGILESGAGRGTLAVQANNHFGIKCHDWTGKKYFMMMIKNRSVSENMIILNIHTEIIQYFYLIEVDIPFYLISKKMIIKNGLGG